MTPSLDVLSIHLDGRRCHVGCSYCYLGARVGDADRPPDRARLVEAVTRLPSREVAVALSRGSPDELAALEEIARASGDRLLTVTTTLAVLAAAPSLASMVGRLNLSIDPDKAPVDPASLDREVAAIRGRLGDRAELVLLATLTTEEFAARLVEGWAAAYLDLPVDALALSSLKPPPPWCGRAFWGAACARLAPLLARHLGRRLFLDCHVAARIFSLGPCPGRPDLSPGLAFRSCVYQPAADHAWGTVDELVASLDGWRPPDACPFEIP